MVEEQEGVLALQRRQHPGPPAQQEPASAAWAALGGRSGLRPSAWQPPAEAAAGLALACAGGQQAQQAAGGTPSAVAAQEAAQAEGVQRALPYDEFMAEAMQLLGGCGEGAVLRRAMLGAWTEWVYCMPHAMPCRVACSAQLPALWCRL